MLEIRELDKHDKSALEIIRKQALEAGFTDNYQRKNFVDIVTDSDDSLDKAPTNQTLMSLVATAKGIAIGYITLNLETGEIESLYVAPNHQGKQCGSRLLKEAIDRAREADLDSVYIDAPRNSSEFFKKNGFSMEKKTNWNEIETKRLRKQI